MVFTGEIPILPSFIITVIIGHPRSIIRLKKGGLVTDQLASYKLQPDRFSKTSNDLVSETRSRLYNRGNTVILF